MELELWLDKYDIKKMAMRDLKHYLPGYKEEKEEDFNEWHTSEGEKRKYISAKVYLEYNDSVFAEYVAIYGLDGEAEDDYLIMV